MKKTAALTIAFLAASASGASAIDWTIQSHFSQELQASDNAFLKTPPVHESYGTISSLMFDVVGRTPTMRFQLKTDVSYLAYFGPGATDALNKLNYGAMTRFEKIDRLTTYFAEASFRDQDARTAQLTELGLVRFGGSILIGIAEAGLKHQLTSIDLIKWSTVGRFTGFTAANTTSFSDLSTTLSWIRRLTPITDVNIDLQFERLAFDNIAHSEVLIWRAMFGFDSRVTRTLTLKGYAGPVFVNASQATLPYLLPINGSSFGWNGNISLIYKIKTVEISVNASRTTGPSIVGDLLTTDSVGVNLRHDLSALSYWFASGVFSRYRAAKDGSPTEYWSASVGYGYKWMRELQLQFIYRYLNREGSFGDAHSHTILLRLTHDYTFLR